MSLSGPGTPVAQNSQTPRKASDQRFRSFAERYCVTRSHLFRVDPKGLLEDQWTCVQDAKRLYNMIERTGQNINPEDGVW